MYRRPPSAGRRDARPARSAVADEGGGRDGAADARGVATGPAAPRPPRPRYGAFFPRSDASMNGWSAPSRTAAGFPDSSPVRWSFTIW